MGDFLEESYNQYDSANGNINFLLGGAMLSVIGVIILMACYCCHKSISRQQEQYEWNAHNDGISLDVFSTDHSMQGHEGDRLTVTLPSENVSSSITSPRLSTSSPPPTYDYACSQGLPTYEAAMRLEAEGYV